MTASSRCSDHELAFAADLTKRLDGRGRIDAVRFVTDEHIEYGLIFQQGSRRGIIKSCHPMTSFDEKDILRSFANWTTGSGSGLVRYTPNLEEADANTE